LSTVDRVKKRLHELASHVGTKVPDKVQDEHWYGHSVQNVAKHKKKYLLHNTQNFIQYETVVNVA